MGKTRILAATGLKQRHQISFVALSLALSPSALAYAQPSRNTLSLDQLRATLERPLFSESRRPPAPAPQPPPPSPPPPPPPSPPPRVDLTGVIVGPRLMIAVLRSPDAADYIVVHQGDSIQGWRVEEVNARSVLISLGDRRQRLELQALEYGGNSRPQGE